MVSEWPNDVLKEIAEALDPTRPAEKYTLQQLRLANRTFNAFASTVLFRDFKTLRLCENYEDTAARIRTLASSSLCWRIENLLISGKCMIPRLFRGGGHSSLYTAENMEGINSIFDDLLAGVRGQFRILLRILGPDFRFKTVSVGDYTCAMPFERPHMATAADKFIALLFGDIFREPAFSDVRFFSCVAPAGDLWHFAGGPETISDAEPAGGAANGAIDFFKGVESIEVNSGRPIFSRAQNVLDAQRHALKMDYLTLGSIIRHSPSIKKLLLGLNWLDERFRGIDELYHTPRNIDSIETLKLRGAVLDTPDQLINTLKYLPNLKELILHEALIAGTQGWKVILKHLRADVPDLISVEFSGLYYQNNAWARDGFIIPGDKSKTRYLRPLATEHQGDLKALRKLLDEIKDRRDEKGMGRGMWLSWILGEEKLLTEAMAPPTQQAVNVLLNVPVV